MGSLPISSSRRRALERQLRRAADARVYRRTLAVLEVDRGRAAAQVADELRVTRQSVNRWVVEYLTAGTPAALADQPRPGRPRGLGDAEAEFLRDVLGGSPRDLGYPHAGWTAPLLRGVLEAGTGTAVAERTIRRKLARLDYAWKQPRYRLAPDPEREKEAPHPPDDPGPPAAERGPGRG